MIEVQEMSLEEAKNDLQRLNYAHLGLSGDDLPYVVPVHYAYDGNSIFIYTTEGKKSEMVSVNPEVCLQIEDVRSNEDWSSVIVFGRAEILTDKVVREKAVELILEVNPKLAPALSVRWIDNWVRQNVEVIIRIRPGKITGRRTVQRDPSPAGVRHPDPTIQ